jgi:glycosyltransferase involved in cell wall biosynthesis
MSHFAVSWLFRRKRALGNFSIENSFAEIARSWAGAKKPNWMGASHYSEGLTKRLNIIRDTRKIQTDILHITGDIHFAALAWPKWKKGRPRVVLTIHDIGFLAEFSGFKRWLIRKFWMQWPLRCVDHLVVVSTATKEAVLREAPWFPVTKTSVIPSVVPQHFKPRQGRPANKKQVALHIGLAENKNLKGHAEALVDLTVHLRIIGEPSNGDHALLQKLNIDYSWASRLSDEEMQAEYAKADLLLFASKLEGFGMPIIEAQTVGVPVITSDLDPMREVAGTGALLCNPHDSQTIRICIKRLLADEDLQASLIAAGRENVKRYSPAEAARQHQELYNQLTHA